MLPTLDSFKWASDSWKMVKASTGTLTWQNATGDLAMQKFQRAVPTGLPADCTTGSVIFEEPRTVEAKDGSFTDWFGPNEVHVYKFTRK